MIASYISEVVLALEPWSGRLKLPMITPGAASDEISQARPRRLRPPEIHSSTAISPRPSSPTACATRKDLLVDALHMKTAVIMSEDAAWTIPLDAEYPNCLPKIGHQGPRPYPPLAGHDRLHADLQQDRGQEAGRHHHRHQPCRRAADGAVGQPAGADPDDRHQQSRRPRPRSGRTPTAPPRA